MNDIVRPVTKDGMAGFDEFGQFYVKWKEGETTYGSPCFHDVREKICCICNRGWEPTGASLRDQNYLDNRAEYAHKSCVIRYTALQEFDFWYRALLDAPFMFGVGQRGPAMESIPNEYWPKGDQWGAGCPWYRVRLLKRVDEEKSENGPLGHTLKLGARRHVYHLEIEEGTGEYDEKLAHELFADVVKERITHEIGPKGMMVHAWGKDKAREYLKRFKKILKAKHPMDPKV